MLWPGDKVRGYELGAMLAYQGGDNCQNPCCTRAGCGPDDPGVCVGWHCSICDEPSSMVGHKACRDRVEAELGGQSVGEGR